MNIVIVGYGSYGKLIHTKYKLFENINICGIIDKNNNIEEFIKTNIDILDIYFDLCIPSDYIFETIKKYIKLNIKNFIIPKTFTSSLLQLEALVELKQKYNLKIIVASQWYYSDINKQLLNTTNTKIEFLHYINNDRRNHYRISNSLLPHILHILLKSKILECSLDNTKINILENNPFRAHFIISQNNNNIEIITDFNSYIRKQTIEINNICINLLINKQDLLENMITHYLKVKDNIMEFYEYEKWIHYIDIELSKNKALVIGAGIFGSLITKELLENNYKTTILDKANSYLLGASHINQCRVHKGYHYPRDDLTANIVYDDEVEFIELFSDAIVKTSNHYYAISKTGSKISNKDYLEFMNRHNLKYIEASPENIILNNDYISNSYKVEEYSFDINKLRSIIDKWFDSTKLNKYYSANIISIDIIDNRYNVVWNVGSSIYSEVFGIIVNATYNNINYIHRLAKLPTNIYQYELCEVFVVKAPMRWKELLTGIAIMDGPFCGIMSFGYDNDKYILYDVELSVLETYIGILPDFKKPDLKNIDNRFNKLINKMKNYFPEIIEAQYLYSMYQTRIVLPNSDDTDKRPTIIIKPQHNFWSLFSGKIVNSISASRQIINEIKSKQ